MVSIFQFVVGFALKSSLLVGETGVILDGAADLRPPGEGER